MSPKKGFKICWQDLGWNPLDGAQSLKDDLGAVAFLVVAPWCPDCQEQVSEFYVQAPMDRPVWLVGEFASADDLRKFAQDHGVHWPMLQGTTSKSEESLNQARFREIRAAFGDTRRWGLPTWIEGRIDGEWLIVERMETEIESEL